MRIIVALMLMGSQPAGDGGGAKSTLPPLVQHELASLKAGEVAGVRLLALPDRPETEFMVLLTESEPAETPHAGEDTSPVQVNVVLPDNYPTNPPSLVVSGRVVHGPWVGESGSVDVLQLRGAAWVGVSPYNYERQLRDLLLRLQRLLFEPPSPAPAPLTPAPGVIVESTASSAAANTLPTAGGAPEPVGQPQAQSSGRPFRISVLAGASRKAGGFMAVSQAADRQRATRQRSRHANTCNVCARRERRSSSCDLQIVLQIKTGVTPFPRSLCRPRAGK